MNNDFGNGQKEQQNNQQNNQQSNGQNGYQYGNPNGQGYDPYGQNPYGQNPYGQNPYGQNPYGQNPYGQNPYGAYGQNPYNNPYNNPYGFPPIYQQPEPIDNNAKTCHTMGLLAVVSLFLMQILSIVFGILALNYAKKSRNALGYECADAKNGRVMGMIGLIAGAVIVGFYVSIFFLAFILALIG